MYSGRHLRNCENVYATEAPHVIRGSIAAIGT